MPPTGQLRAGWGTGFLIRLSRVRIPPGPLFLHWEVSQGVSFSVTRYPTCLPTPTAKIPTVTTGRCVSVTIGDPVVHGLPHVFWRVATERIRAWNYRPDCIACT